jgi:hypothetical protein
VCVVGRSRGFCIMFFVRPCWSMVSNIFDLCMFASGLYLSLTFYCFAWYAWLEVVMVFWSSVESNNNTVPVKSVCGLWFFAQSNSSRLLFFFDATGLMHLGFGNLACSLQFLLNVACISLCLEFKNNRVHTRSIPFLGWSIQLLTLKLIHQIDPSSVI